MVPADFGLPASAGESEIRDGQAPVSDIEFDYEYLTRRALKRVVQDVLSVTAELKKTPGEHHFYIEFETGAPGVDIPDFLREAYPETMTIVLQHQFDDLIVDDEHFAVTLWFKGKPARLSIAFEALTNFADPSVAFGLRFVDGAEEVEAASEETETEEASEKDQSDAQVISLDSFRKK